MPRLSRCLLLLALLLPTLARQAPSRPIGRCAEEGRGEPPRRWLGCAADGGPPRELAGDERLLLGVPLDVNRASARDLAFVPGLSASLAAAVVAARHREGPFVSPDDLLRIHGIGPKRLALARPFLAVPLQRVGVAEGGE
jgi:competence protein ComEA